MEEKKYLDKVGLEEVTSLIKSLYYTKTQVDELLSSSEESFSTYISNTAPSVSNTAIWIYNQNAYNYVSGEMVIAGEEPIDKSKNPTWLT